MNVGLSNSSLRMSALAFLYDNIRDSRNSLRKLAPEQIEEIATIMASWRTPHEDPRIVPMTEVERREIVRAISLNSGNIAQAAKALGLSKTTVYRKLRGWGYTVEDRMLQVQAAALAGDCAHTR